MRILLHTCCAPCLSGARISLEEEGVDFSAYFYNPNIHPYTEYTRRIQTLQRYAYLEPFELILSGDYPYEDFLKKALGRDDNSSKGDLRPSRCRYCYYERLSNTALQAKKRGFDAFSTTLLLSKYQDHEGIRNAGEEISNEIDVPFYYNDMRRYWKETISISKKLGLYRQGYCGCLFSEVDRYRGKED